MAESSVSLLRGTSDVRAAGFEQALYDASPLGALLTSILLFLGLIAMLVGASLADRHAPLAHTSQGWTLQPGIWPGLVLSLLISVALGMQRYARKREWREQPELVAVMPDCLEHEARFYERRATQRLWIATAIGAICGAASTLSLLPTGVARTNPAMFAWFFAVDTFVSLLFARGIAYSIHGAETWARSIDHSLKIDLLRIDSLNVIGRHGARNALIWFSVAAVVLLFFVGRNTDLGTLVILVASALMGGWIFIRPMERVHRRIRAAKKAELESVRLLIERARAEAPGDVAAAARLPGLLAYESRIEGVREWPFDQPTGLRVAAYVLIPAIPWIGQAVVQRIVERAA
ncbi:MAG TPA: hypothetical protein VLC74_11745 [Rhizomicrobium sp.]|nr:hypothetical protein [Rhizomicrobium sp.]